MTRLLSTHIKSVFLSARPLNVAVANGHLSKQNRGLTLFIYMNCSKC